MSVEGLCEAVHESDAALELCCRVELQPARVAYLPGPSVTKLVLTYFTMF
jgi:hypothetical protein